MNKARDLRQSLEEKQAELERLKDEREGIEERIDDLQDVISRLEQELEVYQ
jgi:cell division protein FtsB